MLDHTKQHCHNKRSMITPEAWTPVIINSQCSSIKWIERSTKYFLPRIQVFIYIDTYKMTLTWMNDCREWIFHPLSTWPVLCSIWRRSLLLTSKPYTRHLFLFFSPPISVYISVLQNCSGVASNLVSVWSLGQCVCCFSAAIAHLSSFWCFGNLQNHPVSLKMYASLLNANSKSVLNIKSWRHPT